MTKKEESMKDRFKGIEGKKSLIKVLKTQKLVEHNLKLAEAIASKGELIELEPSKLLITQGASDTHVFFIINGEVQVYVNDRHVATRGPTDAVGEMALIDPSARRSATVKTSSSTLVLKLKEPDFRKIAKAHPQIWKPIVQILAARLRERSKFHRAPNVNPTLFIGSSVEGLPVAKQIEVGLKHSPIRIRPWHAPGIFGPGGVSIDVLLAEVDQSDFAAFVFGPDDKVISRKAKYEAPRDNVIFELGLFMGHLSRHRAFIIKDHKSDIKIPTDLLGVTPITYHVKQGEELAITLSPVYTEIANAINKVGVR